MYKYLARKTLPYMEKALLPIIYSTVGQLVDRRKNKAVDEYHTAVRNLTVHTDTQVGELSDKFHALKNTVTLYGNALSALQQVLVAQQGEIDALKDTTVHPVPLEVHTAMENRYRALEVMNQAAVDLLVAYAPATEYKQYLELYHAVQTRFNTNKPMGEQGETPAPAKLPAPKESTSSHGMDRGTTVSTTDTSPPSTEQVPEVEELETFPFPVLQPDGSSEAADTTESTEPELESSEATPKVLTLAQKIALNKGRNTNG